MLETGNNPRLFPGAPEQYTESICLGTDGFCFTLPDGSRRIILHSCSVSPIPLDFFTDNDAGMLHHTVFPDSDGQEVLTDTVTGLRTAITFSAPSELMERIRAEYNGIPVFSSWHTILEEMAAQPYGVIHVLFSGSGFGIACTKDRKLLALKQMTSPDSYRLLYTVLKIWNDASFTSAADKVVLSGIGQVSDGNFLRNLKSMLGEETVCV